MLFAISVRKLKFAAIFCLLIYCGQCLNSLVAGKRQSEVGTLTQVAGVQFPGRECGVLGLVPGDKYVYKLIV